MAPDPATVATSLLTVVATLLPLLIILFQFMVSFGLREDTSPSLQDLRRGLLFVVIAVGLLIISGVNAASYLSQNYSAEHLSNAIVFLQGALFLTGIAGVIIYQAVLPASEEDEDSEEEQAEGDDEDDSSEASDSPNQNHKATEDEDTEEEKEAEHE